MIINNTKAGARHPVNIEHENNLIEVVPEFKLLGCTIDDKLHLYKLYKLYNLCLYILLRRELNQLSIETC